MSDSPAEEKKKLGNDAFAEKNFDEAIVLYTDAIKLDPDNAVYYSNRSACHASKGDWQLSLEDAQTCVAKDPKFMKGYYRLSIAQIEIQKYDDALVTVTAALKIEPENDQMIKQARLIRNKKSAASQSAFAANKPKKQMDEQQRKEFEEIRDQTNAYSRDLRGVNSHLNAVMRDTRANQVTTSQVKVLEESVNMYRSVGKAYVLASKDNIEASLQKVRTFLSFVPPTPPFPIPFVCSPFFLCNVLKIPSFFIFPNLTLASPSLFSSFSSYSFERLYFC